jgi:hypothetical protein
MVFTEYGNLDNMAGLYDRPVKDDEYIGRVRKHKPSSLLPLIAAEGARYWENQSWLRSPSKKFTPWALADIARVTLASGNENRKDATQRDLLECAAAYVALADPELGKSADARDGFLLRIWSEQLVFQDAIRNELGRSAALFEQTMPVRDLQVMQPGWAEQLFGCSVSQYVGIGFLLHVMARINQGRFSLDVLENPDNEPITSQIPLDLIRNVLGEHFIGDPTYFRREGRVGLPSQLRRFTFNPLLERPVVSGVVPELLVPVPGQLVRKVSPLGIWYSGYYKWGSRLPTRLATFLSSTSADC